MMTLRLDTEGLRSLIKENPSFKLDIQQAVLDNIKRDNIQEAVKARIDQCLASMCTKGGTYYAPTFKATDPALIKAITDVVQEEAKRILGDTVLQNVEFQITRLVEQERAKIREIFKDQAKEALLLAITPEMAREIVLQKLL